ncbi:MAG: ketopantoate reductase family protein [Candidatus Hodarchaeales archaeon]
MRVAVCGVGAIGGPIAVNLVENGVDVIIVTKHQDLANKISTEGLEIRGMGETRKVQIPAVARINDLEEKFDVVFFAMKANAVMEAAKEIKPHLEHDSVVVTLQNGIVEDLVAGVVGVGRVIGTVVGWASTMIEPGIIEKTSNGDFYIGLLGKEGNIEKLNQVKDLLELTQPVNITDNIYGCLFSKLIINSCITGLGAVCGLTFGQMLSDRRTRNVFMGIALEGVNVANAQGIKLEKVGGLKPTSVVYSKSKVNRFFKHALIRIVGYKVRKGKSSSLQSLERGRKTEIDSLNGYIVEKGKMKGVNTPINEGVVQNKKKIESGEREISSKNLLEIPEPS